MADPNTAQSKPRLVAVGADGDAPTAGSATPASNAASEGKVVSRGLFWLVLALLVAAGIALAVMGQGMAAKNTEIAALSGQVEGLQVDLSAANARVQTYEMQLSRIRTGVSELFERTAVLHELVSSDPMASPPREAPQAP